MIDRKFSQRIKQLEQEIAYQKEAEAFVQEYNALSKGEAVRVDKRKEENDRVKILIYSLMHGVPTHEAQLQMISDSFFEENTVRVDEGKFRCNVCRKLFKGTEFVRKHIQLKHSEQLQEANESAIEKIYHETFLKESHKLRYLFRDQDTKPQNPLVHPSLLPLPFPMMRNPPFVGFPPGFNPVMPMLPGNMHDNRAPVERPNTRDFRERRNRDRSRSNSRQRESKPKYIDPDDVSRTQPKSLNYRSLVSYDDL